MFDQQEQNKAPGNAQSKAGDIQQRAALVAEKIAQGGFEIILEHKTVLPQFCPDGQLKCHSS